MLPNAFRARLRTTTPVLLRRNLSSAVPRVHQTLLNAKPTTGISFRYPTRTQIIVRTAASQVSGRPGSQTIGHAATNIKEEVGNSTADLAKTIAGGNYFSDAVEPTQQTFVSPVFSQFSLRQLMVLQLGITNSVAHAVPKPYIVFGLAGGLPYLGSALTTVYLARQAGEAATGTRFQRSQIVLSLTYRRRHIFHRPWRRYHCLASGAPHPDYLWCRSPFLPWCPALGL